MNVAPAAAADLEALAALRAAFWADQCAKGLKEPVPGCTPDDLAKLIDRPRTHLLVANGDDGLVGYLFGVTRLVPGAVVQKVSSVEEVMTRPGLRQGGVARALVAAAMARFAEDGATRVQLRVLTHNDEAMRFWDRLGFAPYLTTMEKALS
ncbi:GNAT family N-acetyltransferase [Sandarakinorhabdus oryzae]|uniref:GNAT family N-acetyltransferase n=1 Tax=Sandarakinorhabdus oryzae TaxID=2675220 RepID=UPI0018CC7278|nr:GNAT family N-acetyltransferase [Sandarakinorhabdus oryzae]